MGETRHGTKPDTRETPAHQGESAPKHEPMALDVLADAVATLDQEYERITRVYRAAQAVRAKVGPSVQAVLAELQTLDARRAALATEVYNLEMRLAELKSDVGKAEAAKE